MMNGNVTMKIRPGRLVCSCKRNKNMMFWNDLIPFVQLQNREKHPWRSDVILQAFSNIPSRKKNDNILFISLSPNGVFK